MVKERSCLLPVFHNFTISYDSYSFFNYDENKSYCGNNDIKLQGTATTTTMQAKVITFFKPIIGCYFETLTYATHSQFLSFFLLHHC